MRIEEQLLAVAPVEVGPAVREITAEGVRCLAPDRYDSFLAAFAEGADEPVLEIHGLLVEPYRLADAQAGAVQELGECAVAEVSRRCSRGRVEKALDLGGESVRGSVRRRFGSSTFAAGLSSRAPSSTWCRKNERTAASRRAMVVEASPSARSCATYAARSSVLASAGERPSHSLSCARSWR